MAKRYVAGALWAFMLFSGWQLVTGVAGAADLGFLGVVLSIAAGVLIATDPSGVIWETRPTRRLVHVADYEPKIDPISAPSSQQ